MEMYGLSVAAVELVIATTGVKRKFLLDDYWNDHWSEFGLSAKIVAS